MRHKAAAPFSPTDFQSRRKAMRPISILLALLLTIALASQTLAADPDKGKVLVEQMCTGCHGSEVFGRKIKSLAALQAQVDICVTATKTDWTLVQKEDVVAYLDKEYYKFTIK
jgi:mono/diheme cytochrome c family protein